MFEPLYFERMRGLCPDNQKQVYDFRRTRTFLAHLARQGVNQVWLNWWKGFGLQHEQECQDQAAKIFPVCRELGLRAVCYCLVRIAHPRYLAPRRAGRRNWIARTQTGQPTSCQVTFQCFRYRPCYSSDGYLGYMEKVLARAINAGADGIHFDNIGMQAEPEACHCERCTRLFREYLQELRRGPGREDLRHARLSPTPPSRGSTSTTRPASSGGRLRPHHWAWIDFKCHVLGCAAQRLTDFVHRRNPDVFVEMNAAEGDGFAAAFWRGND